MQQQLGTATQPAPAARLNDDYDMVRVSDKDEAQNISTDSLPSWSGAPVLRARYTS